MGRTKCAVVRSIATKKGWLAPGPLPDDAQLAVVFEVDRRSFQNPVSPTQPHEERIKEWVEQGIQATTIYEALVTRFGFTGSYSSVRRRVRKIRGATPRASCMLDFAPGEAAQVDFGKGPTITDVFTGAVMKTWIFVMTLCFSRHMYAEIVTDQKVETWLACHRRAFEWFGGVVAKLIIDNPKCAITRACYTDPDVQRSYGELAEGYGFLISPCPVRDPRKKGRVESGVKYVKNRFLPLRTFRTLADANTQLAEWVLGTAGNRIHGTTHKRPLAMFAETEKPLLKALPDVPVQIATWTRVKVHGNCHVQFEKAYYSAPFRLVHRELFLKATDTSVKLYHDIQLVATHPRLKHPGQRSTVEEHMPPEALAYKMQDPQWCLKQAEAVGPQCHRFVRRLFAHNVLDNLRAAQGVIRLGNKYGPARLEAACIRALHFNNVKYRTVKTILHQGLDQGPLYAQSNVIPLASTYTGQGRFLRRQVCRKGGTP
ncbi:MAG: IS21 family transposase, partial [Deltaproteobacteria bacterium]|nr:IS21 family transposase [Deltaproteobacteria bacterium]